MLHSAILDHVNYDVNLVTALVPSETACFASSPGRTNRTAVCTSLLDRVWRPEYLPSLPASVANFSNTSLMKLFMIDMDFLEIPVSG
mmetsp:Transcript_7453/g.8569  ORF Transcript_7453/g.8569 Transcript_7453/m.8569 type:complete len:87 (+) Transcript_7453:66-326(+)